MVAGEVVVDIKSVSQLSEVAMAQVLYYLKGTGLSRGLLFNFGMKRLSTESASSPIDRGLFSIT